MPDEDKCKPDYWFLKRDDNVDITLRETGQLTTIPQSQLLGTRGNSWKYHNHQQSLVDTGWGLSDAENELIAPYTSGNEVKDLVDGEEFMSDLHQAILDVKKGDFVLIAGWEFWQYRSLLGRVLSKNPHVDDKFLKGALATAVQSGADVRVLAYANLIPGVGDRTKNFIEVVGALSNQRVSACLDKTSDFAMSHHQKEVVIGRSNFKDSRAYVGGMDLAVDRWDGNNHSAMVKDAHGRNYGWHDIQVVVQGDAVLQLWANFAERWKDVFRRKNVLPCPVPAWDWKTWATRPKKGNKHVQVLRTVAPASAGNPMRFMTNGERSVLCGLKKAIEKAECYIYIEEQFLWDCELADLIGTQMRKSNSKLRLIIVMTAGCELPWVLGDHAFHLRSEFFRKVMGVNTTAQIEFGARYRVYPYGVFQTNNALGKAVYVHSKLMIIDDRYAAIGSANVDERSMHIETELTVGIVDGDTAKSTLDTKATTVCQFAMKLRDRLWREHLGVKSDDATFPTDPVEVLNKRFPGIDRRDATATNAWPTTQYAAEQTQRHHLRCYVNLPGAYLDLTAGRRLLDRHARKFHL